MSPRSSWPRTAIACATLAIAASASAAEPALSLIPQPAALRVRQGTFQLGAQTAVSVRSGDAGGERIARWLIDTLHKSHGPGLVLAKDDDAAPIVLERDASAPAGEGYTLDIAESVTRIAARDDAGLFRGATTLYQLLTRAPKVTAMPALHIEDAPRFAWRGVLLDSARHMQTPQQIRALLDQMALHKLNVLHWHLTDDQGWRIQIKRYPKLTDVGAWRTPPDAGRDGEPARYGGFYTQQQIRELVRYAADRYVTIVPELDLPGHATAAVASYPQFGASGKQLAVSSDAGVHANLYNVDDATLDFLRNVLDEVMKLFPGRYIHLGGDEAIKDQWQASPVAQARMHALGLKNEEQLQGWMMSQLGGYLARHGRRMIGWDEILDGRVPPDAVVMSWRGTDGAVAAATQGHDVVMAPSPQLYLDHLQTGRLDEITGREGVESLADVYRFEPVSPRLDAAAARHILGAQGNAWTEHMPSMIHVERSLFPRMAALAEVLWTPPARRNWDDFLARMPAQLARYRAVGFGYSDTAFAPDIDYDRAVARRTGRTQVSLANQVRFGTVHYTLDGSAPTVRSPVYARPFEVSLPTTVTAAAFTVDGQLLAMPRTERIDRDAVFSRVGLALTPCAAGGVRLHTQPLPDLASLVPVYAVDLMDGCQRWQDAPLAGVTEVVAQMAVLPRNYQLAHDAKLVKQRPPRTSFGELLIARDDCKGAPLASVPLPDPAHSPRHFTLRARLPAGQRDGTVCLITTGAANGPIYAYDRVQLKPGQAHP